MSGWQIVRAISGQIAEGTAAPLAALCIDVDAGKRCELSFGAITFGGTVAASAAKLCLWRSSGGRVDKVAEIILATGVIPVSPTVETNADALWVTVEAFTGGTAPTLTVDVYARTTG